MKKEDIIAYEYDASQIKGLAKGIVFLRTIEEAKEKVKDEKKICIRGGGSGLVGGAVPRQGQDVVFDTSKLQKIGKLDIDRMTIEVEAGVILEDLQDHLRKHDLEFPVNPSSKSICTIGGMIATNAVGSRAIRYGDTKQWVRWIDVIDSEGNIERKGKTEIGDYAGMEGITGLIVKACLNLQETKKRSASLIKIQELDKMPEILRHLKEDKEVSMIEFIDKTISEGIGLEGTAHLIVEYENDRGILSGSEYEDILKKRDLIYPFLASEGYQRIEDPKLMPDVALKMLKWLEKRKIPSFGHISVGIIHPCFYKGQEKYIPELLRLVKISGGRFSGEHGVGLLKKEYVEFNDKKILENIKKRTDKNMKFNIGKVI